MELDKLRSDAQSIFNAGLKAVDASQIVKKHLERQGNNLIIKDTCYNLDSYKAVYVIGAGKASAAMARPIEEILGDRLKGGIINVKYGYSVPLEFIEVNEAGHPVPDEAGLKGTRRIVKLLQSTGEGDLVIALISGGGSALLPYPVESLTLKDKQQVTSYLIECGASIQEINTVRKHISRVKGGKLAKLAYPSPLISLILSDVIGDDESNVASGPTVPDESTFLDCLHILEKYGISRKIPSSVLEFIRRGIQDKVNETPKPGEVAFSHARNITVGSNVQAVEAAREKAEGLGYNTMIISSFIKGEAREIAKVYAAIAREIISSGKPVNMPACVISGGETTVTLQGKGLGGRNQEFALAAAIEIGGLKNVTIFSAGTDGIDGLTEAAGAIVDGTTLRRAELLGLDADNYLKENDSYHFFKPLGDLIITGPTCTNVMDLMLIIVGKREDK